MTSLRAIHRYKIASSFPVGQTTTVQYIAKNCGLQEDDTARIIKSAATYHVFKEVEKGVVAHTAASKALVQVPMLDSWSGMVLEEL